MRYLSIDYGEKRIGLAVSDPDGSMAFAHSTFERQGHKKDAAAIVQTVRGLGVEAIVVGLPRSLADTQDSPNERKVRAFGAVLTSVLTEHSLNTPLSWWDERFSTREALSGMRASGFSQKQGRDCGDERSVDARAAAVILQGFLDSQNQLTAAPNEGTQD